MQAWGAWSLRCIGPVWHTKPDIEPSGLDIGGTCGILSADSSRGLSKTGETNVEGLRGSGAYVPIGRQIWHVKPNIELHGLDIGGASGYGLAEGSGGMWDATEAQVAGLGRAGAGMPMGGWVWHTKLNIEHDALNIGKTSRQPPTDSSRGMQDAKETLPEGLGGLEPNMHNMGGC